jgi:hypothetical protein
MIVLDEEIGWRTLMGGAMIMLGIAFIVVRRAKNEKPDEVPSAKKPLSAGTSG